MHTVGEKGRGHLCSFCTYIITVRDMLTMGERARHEETDEDQEQWFSALATHSNHLEIENSPVESFAYLLATEV